VFVIQFSHPNFEKRESSKKAIIKRKKGIIKNSSLACISRGRVHTFFSLLSRGLERVEHAKCKKRIE
jgi:hypothetical protein